MAKIVVEMTGDEAKLYRSIQKLVDQQKKLEGGLKKTGGASKQAGDEVQKTGRKGEQAFGPKAVGMLKSFAGALGLGAGVAGAVQLVRSEYQALIEAQRRAKETSMTAAEAQASALRNLGATTVGEREAFIGQIGGISARTGASERDLYQLASDALSARGALSVQDAMSAIEAAVRIAPESSDVSRSISGAALDISKAVGGASAEQAIGYLMAVGQRARVTDTGLLAQNLAPALTGAMASGATAKGAGAMWASITGGMADPTGRRSGTAAIQLSRQLAEYLPEKDTYTFDSDGQKVVDQAGTGLKTLDERIRYLQKNADERLKFLATASFETKARASVEQLLSGEGSTAAAYAKFYAELPSMKEAGGLFEKRLGIQEGAGLQRTAAQVRAVTAGRERLETADVGGAESAALRDEMAKMLQSSGMGGLASKLGTMAPDWLGSGRAEDFMGVLEKRRKTLLAPHFDSSQMGLAAMGGMGAAVQERPATAKETQQAEILGAVLDRLTEIRDDRRETQQTKNPTLGRPDRDK